MSHGEKSESLWTEFAHQNHRAHMEVWLWLQRIFPATLQLPWLLDCMHMAADMAPELSNFDASA